MQALKDIAVRFAVALAFMAICAALLISVLTTYFGGPR